MGHMGDTTRDRVSIDGSASYDRVDCDVFDVDGTGKVDGDVSADEVSIDGTAKVDGRVDAGTLDVDGTAKAGGDVHSERVEVDGTAKFGGALSADALRVDGTGKVTGNLDGHDVAVDGTLKVSGSLVAATAAFDGSVKVGGLTDVTELEVDGTAKLADANVDSLFGDGGVHAASVTAGTFDLTVKGRSEIDELAATDVFVRDGGRSESIVGKLLGGERVFEVGTVEAETAELDATRADVVAAESLALGPDTEVGTVYSDNLDAHPDAEVGEERPFDEF